jgi:primase-polymerase (primpol)-like protein
MNGGTANATDTAMTHWVAVDPNNIPATLRDLARWVVWRAVSRDGKVTKIAYRSNAPTKTASSTDPGSWTDFETAMKAYAQGKADGPGFVLDGDGLIGVDIDGCIDPTTGRVSREARQIRIGSSVRVPVEALKAWIAAQASAGREE